MKTWKLKLKREFWHNQFWHDSNFVKNFKNCMLKLNSVNWAGIFINKVKLCDNSSTQLISIPGFYTEMYIGFKYYPMICHNIQWILQPYFMWSRINFFHRFKTNVLQLIIIGFYHVQNLRLYLSCKLRFLRWAESLVLFRGGRVLHQLNTALWRFSCQ